MDVSRGLAGMGIGSLAVAVLALGGSVVSLAPAQGLAEELVTVAAVAFFLGVLVLLGAALARGVSQVNRAVGTARRPE